MGKAPTTDIVLVGLLVVVVGSYIISDMKVVEPVSRSGPAAGAGPVSVAALPVAPAVTSEGLVTIAVLPFTNMSSDEEQEYFSDGITEEILNALVHIDGLKVTSRTSAFAFKGSPDDLPTVARKLGVAHVLEGSVRRSGNMVRITAQLIRASDDAHLWSNTYDRDLKNIFQVQEEISRAIAAALKLQLVQDDTPVSAEIDPAVYDLYLHSLENIARSSFIDINLAIERLDQVVEAEPGFARAHASQARAISFALLTGAVVGEDWVARVERSSYRALALDGQLSDVFGTIGTAAYLRGDIEWAIDNYQHADLANALGMWDHFTYANALVDLGRIEEAQRMAARSVAVDPLNFSVYFGMGMAEAAAGEMKAGLAAFEAVHEIIPDNPNAYYFSMLVLGQQGEIGLSLTYGEKSHELDSVDPEPKVLQALGYLSLAMYDEAEEWIDDALESDPDIGFALGVKSLILAARGKTVASRVLALRALEPETGAANFRFAGNNMLVHMAYPKAIGGAWPTRVEAEYLRHWPELWMFRERGTLFAGSQSAIVSPASLSGVDYAAHLIASGKDEEARQVLAWIKDNVAPSQFWTFTNSGLMQAEVAILEGDSDRALGLIEAAAKDGFLWCWQWRLRDNPHFAPIRHTPRFEAALSVVEGNIARQKQKYLDLKTG